MVGGSLELHIIERDARRGVGVGLPLVKRLAVTENRADFSGPGFLAVVDGRTVRRIPGTVVASVVDNGTPRNDEDDLDTIRVHFTPTNPDGREFQFSGEVRQGDIAVQDAPNP